MSRNEKTSFDIFSLIISQTELSVNQRIDLLIEHNFTLIDLIKLASKYLVVKQQLVFYDFLSRRIEYSEIEHKKILDCFDSWLCYEAQIIFDLEHYSKFHAAQYRDIVKKKKQELNECSNFRVALITSCFAHEYIGGMQKLWRQRGQILANIVRNSFYTDRSVLPIDNLRVSLNSIIDSYGVRSFLSVQQAKIWIQDIESYLQVSNQI